jgi:hypothetical protein
MGTSRRKTESLLERAKAALDVRVKVLQGKGVEAKDFGDDPKWRELNARVRQVGGWLRKVAEIETLNEELAKHKAERQARIAAEKAEAKAIATGKKPKPGKEKDKDKEKGKGEKAAKKEKPPKEKPPKKEKEPAKGE